MNPRHPQAFFCILWQSLGKLLSCLGWASIYGPLSQPPRVLDLQMRATRPALFMCIPDLGVLLSLAHITLRHQGNEI